MATKRFRGGAWRYTVRRAGVLPRPVYLTFNDEKEGDEFVRRLEAQLDRGVVPDDVRQTPKRIVGVRDHARRYVAEQHISETDRACLRIVVERLPASLEMRNLTFAWASAWVSRMKREDNLAPVTIRHHVGALARCFDWLAAHGDLTANPLRMLPKGYAVYTPEDTKAAVANEGVEKHAEERDRRVTAGEEKRIREALENPHLREPKALRMLLDLALESAMRMREMYTLAPGQIDLRRRTVFLDRTKNGDKRQVPLSSVAVARLREYLPTLADGATQVFPWWDGALDKRSLDRCTSLLSRQFARIFESAGVVELHFHDLRHEAASRFFERTKLSDMEIAKITGHRSLRSLARYANLRGSKLATRLW